MFGDISNRVLKYGRALDTKLYTWDSENRIFSTEEDNLVIDFFGISNCTLITDSNCIFNTSRDCIFITGRSCVFNTNSGCKFTTDSGCTFNTESYCTFNTGSWGVFNTGWNCDFKTKNNCDFKTKNNCTFDTGNGCTFKVGEKCVIINRVIDKKVIITQPTPNQKLTMDTYCKVNYDNPIVDIKYRKDNEIKT